MNLPDTPGFPGVSDFKGSCPASTGSHISMKSETLKNIKCPICRKPVNWEENPYRPFCSERCRTIDLGAWVGEEYHIPDKKTPVNEEPEKS